MGFNKYIKSGNQFELYEYQKECFAKGRPVGYKNSPRRQDLSNGGIDLQFQRKFTRRKDNSKRSSMAFQRLVLSNLEATENPLLITLTFAENRTNLSDCSRFFNLFIVRLRRKFGKNFRYIAVPEFQKRGAVHYHSLFWGLPSGIAERERQSREIAKLWGEGFVDIIVTDGHKKLSRYLAKYMLKAIEDPRLLSMKAYFASRNVFRPVSSSGFPMWWVEQEYNLHEADLSIFRQFNTAWLGECRYRLFSL